MLCLPYLLKKYKLFSKTTLNIAHPLRLILFCFYFQMTHFFLRNLSQCPEQVSSLCSGKYLHLPTKYYPTFSVLLWKIPIGERKGLVLEVLPRGAFRPRLHPYPEGRRVSLDPTRPQEGQGTPRPTQGG